MKIKVHYAETPYRTIKLKSEDTTYLYFGCKHNYVGFGCDHCGLVIDEDWQP